MITLTDITALQVWSTPGLLEAIGEPCRSTSTNWSSGSMCELRELGLERLGIEYSKLSPLHILVDSKEHRIRSEQTVSHVCATRLPPGSLYQLAPGLLVVSPELCCLEMARHCSVAQTAAIEMECMGFYGRVPTGRGFVDRDPLFTKEEFERFLQDAKGCHGVKTARRALSFALERSRSPMETKSLLVLTLPAELGGYGLPKPELNYTIWPSPEQRRVSQFPHYTVDACWPRQRVIYEYDSYAEHLKMSVFDSDAMKWNSLTSMDWKVKRVTNEQLSGISLDILARQLAQDLGVELIEPSPYDRDKLLQSLR